MTIRHLSRRQFGALAATGMAGVLKAASKRIPIGVQLYSVRKLCAQDLPGTLAGIGKLGYQGVEFAGYYDRSAAELKKMLDDNGLKCCGTHVGVETLLGDNLAKSIEFNQAIGNRNIICPGLPEKYRSSRQAWADTAKLFNEISDKLKPHDLRVGYHNHSIEFQPMDGENPWDTFFSNTKQDVVMQLDIGHAVHAGADPVAVMKKYAGRAKTVHVKEYSPTKPAALLGDGEVKWKEVLATCETVGATEWYIIEEESNAYTGLGGIAESLNRLRALTA